MSQVASREISAFEYEGKFQYTLQTEVFCSPYWQDDCCREVDTPEGRKVRISCETYPPGGKGATAMRHCDTCRKWAPHTVRDSACTDCQVESEESSFEQQLDHLERDGWRGLAEILYQVWWKRPFVPERRENDEDAKKKKKFKRKKVDDPIIDEENAPPIMEITTFREEGTPGGRHWLDNMLEIPEAPSSPLRNEVLAGLVRRHLEWVARDTPRRAVGCSVVLLPEGENKLREEISHYESTGRIMSRAKRQNTTNPRIRYRKKFT